MEYYARRKEAIAEINRLIAAGPQILKIDIYLAMKYKYGFGHSFVDQHLKDLEIGVYIETQGNIIKNLNWKESRKSTKGE